MKRGEGQADNPAVHPIASIMLCAVLTAGPPPAAPAMAWPPGDSSATAGLTLARAIVLARTQSASAALALNRFRASYWARRTSRAVFLPTLSLRITAPSITRSISKITQPDGSERFVPQSFTSSTVSLSMRKIVGFTGGEIFFQSELERLDHADGGAGPSYLARPVSFGIRQPLLIYNAYRWQERIEPLRYEEARRQYAEDLESIAISATNTFFDLLSAQDRVAETRANYASTDTLNQLTKRRFAAGKMPEETMLQTELAFLNARLELQRAEIDLRARSLGFRSYLGLRDSQAMQLEVRYDVPDFAIDPERAVIEALAHRSDAVGFERRTLDAEREIFESRANSGLNADVFATYGRTNTTGDLSRIFNRGQEDERITLGIEIPLLDWGRAEARRRVAESNRDVALISVEQARADFNQDVSARVAQFNVQHERIQIASRADVIAQRRFEMTMKAYLAGRSDITAVNIALHEKDAARCTSLDALRGYWTAYYDVRRATLYDFRSSRPIEIANPQE